MRGDRPFDLAILGAGGAGQLVLLALAARGLPLRVAVVDPVERRGHDRTWCWWAASPGPVAPAVAGSWRRLLLAGGGGEEVVLDLDPLRYHLVRSGDLYDLVAERVAASPLHVERLRVAAGGLAHEPGAVRVSLAGPPRHVHARWVLDSRPARPARPGRVNWRQHFLGWVLPAEAAPALGEVPVLMDFRTAQPAAGLSFGYCLPLPGGEALVEYTEFAPGPMDEGTAADALAAYVALLGGDPSATPRHVETGVIPMTDARFTRRPAPRVVRLGTAGGATRGSTGYTFAAMARQADAVADALARRRPPVPPPAYPARHRAYDAVMLSALDRGLVDGPAFFRRLFDRQPAERVLRFLDGASTVREELAVMASAPPAAMLRATLARGLPAGALSPVRTR